MDFGAITYHIGEIFFGEAVAIEVGALAAALVAIAAALKLWPNYRNRVKQTHMVEKERQEEMFAKIAHEATSDLADRLFSPNGGRSLYDIAQHLDQMNMHVSALKASLDTLKDRTARVENQIDRILIPNQKDISTELLAQRRPDIDTEN